MILRSIKLYLHPLKSAARVVQSHAWEWFAALLFLIAFLAACAWFDEREQRGYWQAEAVKHMAAGVDYKEAIQFAVFRDGTCLHRTVRREWEHAARVNCSLAKQFVEVVK